MDEEKKILMDQLKELTKIVELKDEEIRQKNTEIREQKFQIKDMNLLIQEVQSRTEEILTEEKSSKKKLKEANELYDVMESFASDSLEREAKIDRKDQDLREREEELKQKEKNLDQKDFEIRNLKKTLSDQQRKIYMQAAILGSLLLGVWLSAGLIGDAKNIVRFADVLFSGSTGIAKVILILVVILVSTGLIKVGCRYVHRYLDMTSLNVSFLGCLAVIIAKEFLGWNSVTIFVAIEVIYVAIRSEVDARNENSLYYRR
mgnify:CR=1 FL=1